MELALIPAHGVVLRDRDAALAAWSAGHAFAVVGLPQASTRYCRSLDTPALKRAGFTQVALYPRRESLSPVAIVAL